MKAILLSLIIILAVGCATTQTQPTETVPVEPSHDPTPPEIIEEPPMVVDPVEVEPEECDMDIDPMSMDHITLSFDDEGIVRKTDGIEFSFYPRDSEGNIIPIEGNLALHLYWTEIFNEDRRSKKIVYSMQKYIKPEDVGTDCSPEKVFIKFADMKKDNRYLVEDGDPGYIKVIFKKTGGDTEFAAEFMGPEGKSLFP
jgi:hypothetical protein